MKYLDFLYLEIEYAQISAIHNDFLEIKKVQHSIPLTFHNSYKYKTRVNRLTSLTHSYTYNDLNQLTDSTTHTYSYDLDGNLVEEKNKITTETKKYYYNSENRLILFEHYPNDVSPADIIANYKYDIHGRRLQKNVNGTVINFFWEDDNLALELDKNLKPFRRYVYGVRKDDVEGYVELSEVTGGMFDQFKQGWYSYIKDQVGTIYKVYSENTQQMIDTRTYDVFGNIVTQTGSSTGNLGFQGKYFDQESGLYYFYHRYYNPKNGRFINEDPIGFEGGLNFNSFVNYNPINFVDPLGLIYLPPDPSGLPHCWTYDPTHKSPHDERYRHPSGLYLDFHKAIPGEKGQMGKTHWHFMGGKSHLPPGAWIPGGDCPKKCLKKKVTILLLLGAAAYITCKVAAAYFFPPSLCIPL